MDERIILKIFVLLDLETSKNFNKVMKTCGDLYSQVTKLKVSDTMCDEHISLFKNLVTLDCAENELLTNNCLKKLKCLRTLKCGINNNLSDDGLKYVKKLTRLDCNYNNRFTNLGIDVLCDLAILNCGYATMITNDGICRLKRLVELNCGINQRITSQCITLMPYLRKVYVCCNQNFRQIISEPHDEIGCAIIK